MLWQSAKTKQTSTLRTSLRSVLPEMSEAELYVFRVNLVSFLVKNLPNFIIIKLRRQTVKHWYETWRRMCDFRVCVVELEGWGLRLVLLSLILLHFLSHDGTLRICSIRKKIQNTEQCLCHHKRLQQADIPSTWLVQSHSEIFTWRFLPLCLTLLPVVDNKIATISKTQ